MSTELVAVTRDIVIILFGVLGTACAITITVLVVLTYRKVARILDDVQKVTEAVRSGVTALSKVAEVVGSALPITGPVAWVVSRLCGGGKKEAN